MEKWYDNLEYNIRNRLLNCYTRKSDLYALVKAKWNYMKSKGKDLEGFTIEDALISILELLDCNNCYIDLAQNEYNDLINCQMI